MNVNKNKLKGNLYLVLVGILLLVISVGCTNKSKSEPDEGRVVENVSPFTGLEVSKETLAKRPLAVMINNSSVARPQSGLSQADLVYEILAEGGITRLMAIYQQQEAEDLGPIRSARPYFVEKALDFNAMYVHCGGSSDALEDIKAYNVASLDEMKIGKKAFWRTTDRKAPHNLYTSTTKLREYATAKGLEAPVAVRPFTFLKAGEENPDGEVANSEILINYAVKSHKVSYIYDKENNSYLRFNGGQPHIDKVTNKQLEANNVLVQFTNHETLKNTRMVINIIGDGQALYFNNGKVYKGYWKKDSLKSATVFYGEKGEEFKLLPGQSWIQVVPTTTKIEF